jgi:2',3'-cyclic-nucleotide 2'-phosphodiesterase
MISVLFFGDIVGAKGRSRIKRDLPLLLEHYHFDFVLANAENSAHGKGITPKIVDELLATGLDALSLGNHSYSKSEVMWLDAKQPVAFPKNLIGQFQDRHTVIITKNNVTLALMSVMGNVFMENTDLTWVESLQKMTQVNADIKICDFHAETTSEKYIVLHTFHDACSAILGTHTHVQTNDAHIYQGCAYITDVGMCGPFPSILGRDVDEVLRRYIKKEKTHYTVSEEEAMLNFVLINFDEQYHPIHIKSYSVLPHENILEVVSGCDIINMLRR